MAFEQKEGMGVLFKNKKTSEKQPDFTGNIKIDGKIIKLAAWSKESQGGMTYLSLSVDNFVPNKFS